MFDNFPTEAPLVDPKRTEENEVLDRLYHFDQDLWEEVDVRQLRVQDSHIANFRGVVNRYFRLEAKPWQISAMKDILELKGDVVMSAGTSQGKSLTFQALLVLSKTGIVLVVCPTLALIDDQVRLLSFHSLYVRWWLKIYRSIKCDVEVSRPYSSHRRP